VSGWLTSPDHVVCYKVLTEGMPWSVASRHCASLSPGGHLAFVTSEHQQETIGSLIADHPGRVWWIGGEQVGKRWLWKSHATDGTVSGSWPMKYKNWAPGEPNNRGRERCMTMMDWFWWDGRWNNDNCANEHSFVCASDAPRGSAAESTDTTETAPIPIKTTVTPTVGGRVNLALGRPTWQSSSHSNGPSRLSVDGNKNTNFFAGSCSHTADDQENPWWAVELDRPTGVYGVNLTNRGDCCGYRLSDFVVGLTDNPPSTMSPLIHGYVQCGQWQGAARNGATMFVRCADNLPSARYVVILTRMPNLNFCELEVYGKEVTDTEESTVVDRTLMNPDEAVVPVVGVNLARGRPTWQSSTAYDGVSGRAVDGNRDSMWSGASCSHTAEGDNNPWWAVDLGVDARVSGVSLVNRNDCCGARLTDFAVGLTNDRPDEVPPTADNVALCGRWPGQARDGQTMFVKCVDNQPPARYVVVMTRQPFLTICELEVFGTGDRLATDTTGIVETSTTLNDDVAITFYRTEWFQELDRYKSATLALAAAICFLLLLVVVLSCMLCTRWRSAGTAVGAKSVGKVAENNIYQSLPVIGCLDEKENRAAASHDRCSPDVWSVTTGDTCVSCDGGAGLVYP